VVVGDKVVVVVVGAAVVVVAGSTISPPHELGGMQRLLPLEKTQQTQPGLQRAGFVRHITLPQYA
jgi:hypothetical protein